MLISTPTPPTYRQKDIAALGVTNQRGRRCMESAPDDATTRLYMADTRTDRIASALDPDGHWKPDPPQGGPAADGLFSLAAKLQWILECR